jgi:hypothetical protein
MNYVPALSEDFMTLFRHAPLLLLSVLAMTGCRTTMQLQVLQPAMVSIPPEIQTLGVIDRTEAKNVGETILGALEGAATGESIGTDHAAAKQSLAQLTTTLSASPRFKVVTPNVNAKQAKSDIWDTKLDWATADRICKNAGCDALVVLEALDSDSAVNVSSQLNASSHTAEFLAQRDTRVLTAWRVYDVKNHVLLDEKRDYAFTNSWTERDANRDAAVSRLPSTSNSVVYVAQEAGDAYAGRIAPTYRWVTRDYYTAGDSRLKEAKHHAKAQDWEGAAKIWTRMLDNDDAKLRGKASYNLALYWEHTGDLKKAYDFAQKAAIDLHSARSRNYVDVLDGRMRDAARLEEQMKSPPPEEKPAIKPRGGRTLKPR